MKKFGKILMTILVIIGAIIFGLLAILHIISPDAIAALIGVLAGGAITSYVQYRISESEKQHQLRTAALDKRLQAHQEAYALWRKLLFVDNIESEEFTKVVIECQQWWNENCLYLTEDARAAFYKAYSSAHSHALYVKIHADAKLVEETWKDVERAGNIIVQGVSLPPIGDGESKRMEFDQKKDTQ